MKDNETIKELQEENKNLRACLESVSRYEMQMHEDSLRIAKEIKRRDEKAIANIILNMSFGNRNNVSFCEIFELRENKGCEKHKYCTDCIHDYIKEQMRLHEEARKQ